MTLTACFQNLVLKYKIYFDIVCAVRRIAMCIKVDKLDEQIHIMRLYLSLSALHVSDSLVWLLCGYSHTTARRMIPTYANCDIQLQNVAPDDGLKSPKHVEHLMVNKDAL